MRIRTFGTGLVFAALLALPGALDAQITIGGGAGVTVTTLTGDDVDDDDADSRTGFYVGASVGIPLGGILGLSPGAYYVQKGAEEPDGDESLDLAYLEIPVLLQVQVTGPDRPLGIALFGGPSFGFNMSCDHIIGDDTVDCGDDISSTEFGALFGAGASFAAGESATVSVNAGLDMGLTSIEFFGEDSDTKNQAYFIGVGVSWLMGG